VRERGVGGSTVTYRVKLLYCSPTKKKTRNYVLLCKYTIIIMSDPRYNDIRI